MQFSRDYYSLSLSRGSVAQPRSADYKTKIRGRRMGMAGEIDVQVKSGEPYARQITALVAKLFL